MNKIQRYFFDENCNIIEFDGDLTHNEIAKRIIDVNPELKEKFNEICKKGTISESIYLVMNGYVYIGGNNSKMCAMYSSISLNQNTKNLMMDFKDDGYYIYDVITKELKDSQKQEIKSWIKEGISRDEIRTRVITKMLMPLVSNNIMHKTKENDIDER